MKSLLLPAIAVTSPSSQSKNNRSKIFSITIEDEEEDEEGRVRFPFSSLQLLLLISLLLPLSTLSLHLQVLLAPPIIIDSKKQRLLGNHHCCFHQQNRLPIQFLWILLVIFSFVPSLQQHHNTVLASSSSSSSPSALSSFSQSRISNTIMSSSSNNHPNFHYWLPNNNNDNNNSNYKKEEEGTNMNNDIDIAIDIDIDALCLGTGRFLRSVLVPILVNSGYKPAFLQTRGRTFMEYMMTQQQQQQSQQQQSQTCGYEVDTVLSSGTVETSIIPCYGAFSLGQEDDQQAFYKDILPKCYHRISIIGVGVTEAGLSSKDTSAMKQLYDLLFAIFQLRQQQQQQQETSSASSLVVSFPKICIVDMDNVPNNGDTIQMYMTELVVAAATAADNKDKQTNDKFQTFLQQKVVFFNTMVDRITSQRDGSNGLVPRCEPTPAKALVLLDPNGDWPIPTVTTTTKLSSLGLVVRSTREELNMDIALKLRIANGTHTAIAHTLALSKFLLTSILSSNNINTNDNENDKETSTTTDEDNIFMKYLDALVYGQILPGSNAKLLVASSTDDNNNNTNTNNEAKAVYEDWRRRLVHPHFGLSSFFITQNGPAKGGIRWGPTVLDLIQNKGNNNNNTIPSLQVSMAFAYAVLLRWLTPVDDEDTSSSSSIYTGWLDNHNGSSSITKPLVSTKSNNGAVMYADGLRYHLEEGWYEYKCPLMIPEFNNVDNNNNNPVPLVKLLQSCATNANMEKCHWAIRQYLIAPEGGGDLGSIYNDNDSSSSSSSSTENMKMILLEELVQTIAIFYVRLIQGETTMKILQELNAKSDNNHDIGFNTPCSVFLKSFQA